MGHLCGILCVSWLLLGCISKCKLRCYKWHCPGLRLSELFTWEGRWLQDTRLLLGVDDSADCLLTAGVVTTLRLSLAPRQLESCWCLLCGAPVVVGTHPDHCGLGGRCSSALFLFSWRQSPCCLLSPPTPKVSVWIGEKSSCQISPLWKWRVKKLA